MNIHGIYNTLDLLQIIQVLGHGTRASIMRTLSVTEHVVTKVGRPPSVGKSGGGSCTEWRGQVITEAPSITFRFYAHVKRRTTIKKKRKNLTLNRVVEISAFKISGSYLVLDEDPENTFRREKRKKKVTFTSCITSSRLGIYKL